MFENVLRIERLKKNILASAQKLVRPSCIKKNVKNSILKKLFHFKIIFTIIIFKTYFIFRLIEYEKNTSCFENTF